MAMTAAGMQAAIKSAMGGEAWVRNPSTEWDEFTLDLATAIVSYIQANANVSPLPAMVAPSGGGPVVGLGSIL